MTVSNNDIEYNLFNKVSSVTTKQGAQTTGRYDITYGPDDRRRIATYTNENNEETKTLYMGSFEVRDNNRMVHYIPTPNGIGAMVVTKKDNPAYKEIYYLYHDHLGSLTAVEDSEGDIIREFSGVYPDNSRESVFSECCFL